MRRGSRGGPARGRSRSTAPRGVRGARPRLPPPPRSRGTGSAGRGAAAGTGRARRPAGAAAERARWAWRARLRGSRGDAGAFGTWAPRAVAAGARRPGAPAAGAPPPRRPPRHRQLRGEERRVSAAGPARPPAIPPAASRQPCIESSAGHAAPALGNAAPSGALLPSLALQPHAGQGLAGPRVTRGGSPARPPELLQGRRRGIGDRRASGQLGRPGAARRPVLQPRPSAPGAVSSPPPDPAAQAGGRRQDVSGGQKEGGGERHGLSRRGRGSVTCARVRSPNQQQQQQGQDERRQQGAVTHGTWEEQPPRQSRKSTSARDGGASRSETLQPSEKVISAADKPNVVNPKPRLLVGKLKVTGLSLSPAPPPPPLLARTGLNQGA